MKYLTIRNVSPELAEALDRERRSRDTSLNRTVLELLEGALGVVAGRQHSNGLGALAGTWTAADLKRFEAAVAPTEQIDEDLWR